MSRDWRLYWHDIVRCRRKVERFTAGMDKAAFVADERTFDAVVRNIELIGEAAKQIPLAGQALATNVDWRKIAGMRDFLAHVYFNIDDAILWDVVINKVPELRKALESV